MVRKVLTPGLFPSTDTDVLTECREHDSELLCPDVAAVAATYELQNGKYHMLNRLREGIVYDEFEDRECHFNPYDTTTWYLTERPRAIYDFDGRVKYYEFGLVEDDEITSTITVYARREAPCAIAYMFPYVLPYDNAGYDYYVGKYPCRVFFDGTGYRAVENGENCAYLNYPRQEVWNLLYEQLPPEDIAQFDELRLRASEPDIEFDDEAAAYWSDIEDVLALDLDPHMLGALLCTFGGHSPTVINEYVTRLKNYLGTNEYCRDYTAHPYCAPQIQQTFWKIGCGPASLAWIYRGLRNYYPQNNGQYLPWHGDGTQQYFNDDNSDYSYYHYNFDSLDNWGWWSWVSVREAYINRSPEVDNGLTGLFYQYGIPVKYHGHWEIFMAPCQLDNAFSAATNNIFTIANDCSASDATSSIYLTNLPVVLLVHSLEHYLVAYGFGGISDHGEPIPTKNLYFLIMDNGYEISNHHYKPYWRAYQKREYYYRVIQN